VKTLTIGTDEYRLVASERDGQWVAVAERAGTGERFGIECAGASEAAAVWSLCHSSQRASRSTAALAALQQAEHAYHRTIAGSAFASPTEGPSAVELQKESVEQVEEARVRLDDIRSRKPE
jgi:hypothetical protein